jgi:putative endonuclease
MIEKGYMYILECSDGSYYTGSTINLEKRLEQHQNGEGANHTKKHLPVMLVYHEVYERIEVAFQREKQIQKWNRKKKEALIKGEYDSLPELSKAFRDLVVRTPNAPGPAMSEPVPEVLEGTDKKVNAFRKRIKRIL